MVIVGRVSSEEKVKDFIMARESQWNTYNFNRLTQRMVCRILYKRAGLLKQFGETGEQMGPPNIVKGTPSMHPYGPYGRDGKTRGGLKNGF